MKMKNITNKILMLLCSVLIVATALTTIGCSSTTNEAPEQSASVTVSETSSETASPKKSVGKGDTVFDFMVVDKEGNETAFEVHTDKDNVGAALLDAGLIAGDSSAYGLYVKTVNGVTLDYDKDKMYWSFYINDAYAQTGVDSTPIKSGETYTFKAAK